MTEDETLDEIDALLKSNTANDPATRAQLIVLAQLAKSLCANTTAIAGIAESLEEHKRESAERHKTFLVHAEREEALVNKGKGASKILAWVFGIAQTAIVVMCTWFVGNINDIKDSIVSDRIEHVQIRDRIEHLEGMKGH